MGRRSSRAVLRSLHITLQVSYSSPICCTEKLGVLPFPDVYYAKYPLLCFICGISYFQPRILHIHTYIGEQARNSEDTKQFQKPRKMGLISLREPSAQRL